MPEKRIQLSGGADEAEKCYHQALQIDPNSTKTR
jgi:hypothetical protein